MEIGDKKTLILSLILIFIAFLLIGGVYSLVQSKKKTASENEQTYSNSYIINSYNVYDGESDLEFVQNCDRCGDRYENQYYYHDYHENYYNPPDDSNWDYSYYGRMYQMKDFLGGYANEYKVYVTNQENRGGYFEVVFNFEKSDGQEYRQVISQYLKAGEKKLFLYKIVVFEKNEIRGWSYNVKKV